MSDSAVGPITNDLDLVDGLARGELGDRGEHLRHPHDGEHHWQITAVGDGLPAHHVGPVLLTNDVSYVVRRSNHVGLSDLHSLIRSQGVGASHLEHTISWCWCSSRTEHPRSLLSRLDQAFTCEEPDRLMCGSRTNSAVLCDRGHSRHAATGLELAICDQPPVVISDLDIGVSRSL